jgi:hypothetical protein
LTEVFFFCSGSSTTVVLFFGTYFYPIFAYIFAPGLAIYFFSPSPPIAPGFKTLPLYIFYTISGSSSPAIISFKAIIEL